MSNGDIRAPEPEQIVKECAEYLTSYLGDVTNTEGWIRNLDPKVNIRGLDDVLSYHFLRTGMWEPRTAKRREEFAIPIEQTAGLRDRYGEPVGVLDFISLLPARLRSLDPAVTQRVEITDGAVRGHIDWRETVQYRYRTGDIGSQKFACRVREKTPYSTRNRVLFAVLSTIQAIYTDFKRNVVGDSKWPTWFEGWGPEGEYRQELDRILNNPHFEAVDFQAVSVTDREITEVKADRDRLYREAAALLEYYRGLGSDWFDEHEEYAASLLSLDLFHPTEENEKGSDVYELYWIFKLLDQVEQVENQLEPFTGGTNDDYRGELLARWEHDSAEYLLFNDWEGKYPYGDSGDLRDLLSFQEPGYPSPTSPSTDEFGASAPTRVGYVHQHQRWMRDEAFSQASESGRMTPDIVLLELDAAADDPTLIRLFVGEVKYSVVLVHDDFEPQVIKGTKRILEYGAYARPGEDIELARDGQREYVGSTPDPLRSPELGLGLFVGHANIIREHDLPGIQIKGWEDDADHPFE
ncbi:hypothetical protein NDI76_19505 [Halogeometricum sp. S1BR25-6]|uniref:Restriction endonuclease n=1 Tax=Halogeometricum salsisoli TaxID=2950536 RepID=A0ABU2GJE4_9EURY|nr:hypothetical protein [Halogeometricum sp. S1BR25-6]MDS0300937.1 hypothetical protein [Halogeometricum sp. S1BR25-6]